MNFKFNLFLSLFLTEISSQFESVRSAGHLKPGSKLSVSAKIHVQINGGLVSQLFTTKQDSCGVEKVEGQYPWLAAIMTKRSDTDWNSSVPFCTGTIIDRQFVITTARCIQNINSEMSTTSMSVRLGGGRLSGNQTVSDSSQELSIAKITTHESYIDSHSLGNDIALLKLSRKIGVSESFGPICWGKGITGDLSLQKVKVVGWSRETSKGYPMGTLFQTDLSILSNNYCNEIYRVLENGQAQIEKSMLCTNGKGQSFCRSDSGSPVMIKDKDNRWTLVGVTIFLGCPLDGYPGISTRVSDFNDWIKKSIKNM